MNGFKTGFGVGNAYDAYVAVIDTTQAGAAGLVYSTYLGGNGTDLGMGIAYAGNRIVYVTGEADTGFPTANALDASYNGGASDAFIAKIDTSQAGAASLLYSTFLGGSTTDLGWDIAVDPQGIVHLVGETDSTDFPQVAAISTHINLRQPFVAKLNASGATLLFSSYFAGGGNGKWAMGVAANPVGDTFIGGYTNNPLTNPVGADRLPDRQPAAGGLRRRRVGRLRVAHRQQRRPDPHQDRVAGARDDEQHGDLHADDRQPVRPIRRST